MKSKASDKIATFIICFLSGFVILLLASLIIYILYNGRGFINPNFLFSNPKIGESGGGIGPELYNSFCLLILSLIITVPFGIGAGIYLAEYAKEGMFLNTIRLCIETMASLPSIVVGLFGFLIFVKLTHLSYTLLAGAIAVSILNLPSLTRVCENSIRAASKGVKEASLGLGATKWQTIQKIVLPSALPQIITGIILSAGRIFGEAAAMLYTSGMSSPNLNLSASITSKASPFNVLRPAESLAVHIWKLKAEGTVPDATKIANDSSAVLVVMVLLFNVLSRFIGAKIYKRYTGER